MYAIVQFYPLTNAQLFIVGICMDCFGTIVTGYGLLYQKLAHKNAALRSERTPYYENFAWVWALGLYVGGQFVVWCAMALCAQTLIACLNCLTMVVAVLGAGPILGEHVSRANYAGVGVLCLAMLWVVQNAPTTKTHLTASDVIANATSHDFLLLCPCAVVPAIVSLMWDKWVARSRGQSDELRWVTCTIIAATFAWFSTIMAKALAGLIFSTIYFGDGQLLNPVTMLLLFPTIALMVANIHFMNLGMMRGVARLVIPTYEALTVSGQVVLGSAHFGEFPSTPQEQFWFLVRIGMVVLGIIALAQSAETTVAEQKCLEAGTAETAPFAKPRPCASEKRAAGGAAVP